MDFYASQTINGCESLGRVAVTVTINSVPVQPSTITGSTSPCQGTSQTYSVTNVSGLTYNWTLPSGWTQTAGGTTNSITVTVGSGTGNITVTPSNGCGNGTARTLSTTVNTVPSQPSTVTGSTTPCQGSSQTYSVTNVSGVTYNWTLPSGWTQTAGGTTNSITVTVGSGSGDITVTPSNGCGNGTARTLSKIISPLPSQPSVVTGDVALCEGSSQSYSVTNDSGVTYNWTFPSGWTQTAGGTTNSITVTVGSSSGDITVTPSNGCGNGTARTLTVSTTTIDNSLALSGTTLTANESGASYQWLDCNNGNSPISGETSQSFTATISGNYAVEITKNGCIETSSCSSVTVLGIDQEQKAKLSAYPNPNNGMFTVSSSIPMMRVEVVNVVGQVVYEQNMNGQTKVDINFEGAPGIYFVRIVTTDNIVNPIIKVTKQ
jgi:trimeric autotransporter adhesin